MGKHDAGVMEGDKDAPSLRANVAVSYTLSVTGKRQTGRATAEFDDDGGCGTIEFANLCSPSILHLSAFPYVQKHECQPLD